MTDSEIDAAIADARDGRSVNWGQLLARHVLALAAECKRLEAMANTWEMSHDEAIDVVQALVNRIGAERDAARAELQLRKRDADRMADEIAALVHNHTIDSRSPIADALLDYRDPPQSDRSDALIAARAEVEALKAQVAKADRIWDEAWFVLSGGDNPHDTCPGCGCAGTGVLKDALKAYRVWVKP